MEVREALHTLLHLSREQREREQQFLAQVERDWREEFTGSIDEFIERDAA